MIYKQRKKTYDKFYDIKVSNNSDIDYCVNNILQKINIGDICITVKDFSTENIQKTYKEISLHKEIEYIELRIDMLQDLEKINHLIQNSPRQTIITNRSYKE
jgi:3-dehydroquinate dehydratase